MLKTELWSITIQCSKQPYINNSSFQSYYYTLNVSQKSLVFGWPLYAENTNNY